MSGLSMKRVALRHPSGGGIDTGPLRFASGRLTVLLGPNGAGKSSLIKAIAGAAPSEIEALSWNGAPVPNGARRARHIAYLSQTRTGPALASVRDVIALGRYPHGGHDPDDRIGHVIEQLGLSPLAERRFGQLSGGEQARVLLGRALAVDAPVLLADEPTASLDPHYALRIMDRLQAEAQAGRVVIVSLHDLSLARRYGEDAVIVDQGRIAAAGHVADALNDAVLRTVFRIDPSEAGGRPI